MDNVIIPMAESISTPIELFENLPRKESDKLLEELMDIYYDENPAILKNLTEVSGDDVGILNLKKEQKFQQMMNEEYAFDVDILRERNDEIALILVDSIDQYNVQVDQVSK